MRKKTDFGRPAARSLAGQSIDILKVKLLFVSILVIQIIM